MICFIGANAVRDATASASGTGEREEKLGGSEVFEMIFE
jgi:hypothetical protein